MKRRKAISAQHIIAGFLLLAFIGTCSCRQTPRQAATSGGNVGSVTQSPAARAPIAERVSAPGAPEIRVAILKNAPSVRISGGTDRKILNAAGRCLQQPTDDAVLEIAPAAGGLSINAALLAEKSITLTSSGDAPLRINDQDASSRIAITIVGRTLLIVAHLNIEEYLAGVLAGEVPFERWHPEALKAQAIASRSYALFQARKNAAEPYDVECTVMSQVFRVGYRSHPALSDAVNSTRGQILTYNGTPFPAYFHSTCGGQTADSTTVFPEQPAIKPLSGVACQYCSASPQYRWRCTLNKAALAEKLRVAGLPQFARINSLEFLDASGAAIGTHVAQPPSAGSTGAAPVPHGLQRATQVRIRHSAGTLQLQGNQFRLAAGPRELKSLLLEQVFDRGETIELAGGGYGHGVGMCQFGAQGLALAGQSSDAILGMYYPGASLTRAF